MKRVRTMVVALVAVCAVGAFGAGAARAGNGDMYIETSSYGTLDCPYVFEDGPWAWFGGRWELDIADLSPEIGCEMDGMSGNGTLTMSLDGFVTFDGEIAFSTHIAGLDIDLLCSYWPVHLGGSWVSWTSGRRFLSFDSSNVVFDSGSILCPGTAFGGSIDVWGNAVVSV